ncbi:MAG: hypothetical protein SV377_08630 [Halobacteria archaeon]|nr:hypothetical protein [Halobacteria archaeon]
MEISGERECLNCGATWNYLETRRIECPECGSVRSKSISDPEFDTTGRSNTEEGQLQVGDLFSELDTDLESALSEAEDRCRTYVSRHGFVEAGNLKPLTAKYMMACEVIEIADALVRPMRRDISQEERYYVTDLIRGLESGDPPDPDDRPDSLREYHNLAVARVVEEYARELARYARGKKIDLPSEVDEARTKARRTQATEGAENDAVEGLRLLRDVYDSLTSL